MHMNYGTTVMASGALLAAKETHVVEYVDEVAGIASAESIKRRGL